MGATKKRSAAGRWVALLRAVNLGSRNKVSMGDLRAVFESIDAEDVSTYVQSGNVVFSSPAKARELERAAEGELKRALGLDVRVLVRSAADLRRVERDNPFARSQDDAAKLLVTFLEKAPSQAKARALTQRDVSPDEVGVSGRHVYLHCPRGYGRSNVSNALVESALGLAATTRNWRTVTKLAELAAA